MTPKHKSDKPARVSNLRRPPRSSSAIRLGIKASSRLSRVWHLHALSFDGCCAVQVLCTSVHLGYMKINNCLQIQCSEVLVWKQKIVLTNLLGEIQNVCL